MGIFGGDSGGVDIVDLRTPEQTRVGQQFGRFFQNRIGTGLEGFRGNRVAGPSDLEGSGLSALEALMNSPLPETFGTGRTAINELLRGEPSTEINPEITQQYFKTGIYDPLFRSFKEDIIPEIEGAYAGNYWGTPRAEATTDAWVDFEENMSSVLSNLVYADEQTRIGLEESANDRQLAAAGLAGEFAGLEENIRTGRINAAMTMGSLPRLLMQAQLDADYNEWIRTRPEYSPVIQQALAFLGTQGLTAVVEPGQESALGGIIGAGLGIIGGGGLSNLFGGGTPNSLEGVAPFEGLPQDLLGR